MTTTLENPLKDTMTNDGWQAFFDGYELSDNPELFDTDSWHAWQRGWAAAHVEYELNIGDANGQFDEH